MFLLFDYEYIPTHTAWCKILARLDSLSKDISDALTFPLSSLVGDMGRSVIWRRHSQGGGEVLVRTFLNPRCQRLVGGPYALFGYRPMVASSDGPLGLYGVPSTVVQMIKS
jgi:hypothetical protein